MQVGAPPVWTDQSARKERKRVCVCVGLVRPRLWARGETSAGLLAPGQARAQDLVTSMGMPGPIVVVMVALRM